MKICTSIYGWKDCDDEVGCSALRSFLCHRLIMHVDLFKTWTVGNCSRSGKLGKDRVGGHIFPFNWGKKKSLDYCDG